MKKNIKILSISIISIMILFAFCSNTFAFQFITSEYTPQNLEESQNATAIKDIGNTIIGTIQTIGTILSVLVLAVLGIKYMLGSAEERAEYKKSMGPYILGAIMVFAITNILALIVPIAKNMWGRNF